MEHTTYSPVFDKSPNDNLLTFPLAMEEVIEGKKITKEEWNNTEEYGFLKDGFLMIHRNNQDYQWLVSEGDMIGEDWRVLP